MVTTSMTRATFTVVMTIVSVFAIPSMILTSGVVALVSAQSASSPLLTEQIKVSREYLRLLIKFGILFRMLTKKQNIGL